MTRHAPAKINLSLRILGRREDGFHEIATRMVALQLADELTFTLDGPAGSMAFSCSDPTVPADASNLVVKAAHLLQQAHGPLPGVKIHLQKNIPHSAGLGGGSSDAATTLLALNDLCQLGQTPAELHALAASIGSDIPFFLTSGMADCTGRGEIIALVSSPIPDWPILLIKLPFAVPTPWAYQQWRTSLEIPGIDYAPQTLDDQTLVNDLERPVFQKHFILAHLKQWLRQQPGVRAALMSGSGSTLFAILHSSDPLPALVKGIHEIAGEEIWHQPTRLAGGNVALR